MNKTKKHTIEHTQTLQKIQIMQILVYCVGIYSVHKETDALSKERQLLDTQREDLAKEIENYNETLRSDSAYSSNPESAYSVRQLS